MRRSTRLALIGALAASTLQAAFASGDQVVAWNEAALQIAVADGVTSGAVHARTLAILHLAMHDALNAIEPRYATYGARSPQPNAAPAAAVAGAAHAVLTGLFPARAAQVESSYRDIVAAIPDGEQKAGGLALGKQIAAGLVSRRAADHFTSHPPYAWRAPAPGIFQPVPPALSLASALTGLAHATPFALDNAAQARAPGPPGLTSSEYSRDFDEVKSLGAAGSTARTADQTAAAHFWHEPSSTQAWNRIARTLVAARTNNPWDSARLFALLNMAIADTSIAVFESKYRYHFWRPVTAIRQADADANPQTAPDPTWSPLLATPSHPEYPSGHAGYCAAAAAVLAFILGDEVAFSSTSPTANPPGSTRSYARLSQAAQECSDARVFAGIHFRTACSHAVVQGRQVADAVTRGFLRPVVRN